jgi:uncharacterized protein YecE (DUF72 family)
MIRIGTAGWTVPREAAGHFEADGPHLERYARVMNCVEINSSFYRSHRAATWQRWAASVPEGFRFSVKAPKAITHEKSLACEVAELRDFLGQISELGSKLGPLLFQLPLSFQVGERRAANFFAMLRSQFAGAVALEPRHASWFAPSVEKLLKEFRIARVAADPAKVVDAASPGGEASLVYYRLHGSPRMYYSSYDEAFLQGIATEMRARRAAETWCIFDNTALGAALGNALKLVKLLQD